VRLGLILALVLPAALARAAPHAVSLLGVSGPGGERFAAGLESDLSELYDVISGEVYRAEALALGMPGASPREVQTVCRRLRIDALTAGAVVATKHGLRLVMVVRDGASGEVIARLRYDLGARSLPLYRERVLSDLVRAFERAGQPIAPAPEAERAPEAPTPEEEEEAAPVEQPMAVRRAAPATAPTPSGLVAGIGPSLLSRWLGFDVGSAPSYAGGAVPGLRVEASVFPLALSAELAEAHPVLASFGIRALYERAFDFRSSTINGTPASPGQASRWAALFVGRIPLGRGAVGGTLTVETGFQQLNWTHQTPADVGVPDVGYGLVDAGLGWQRALTRLVLLELRAAGLALVDAGAITSRNEYGDASGGGLEAAAGVTVRPLSWLWLRLSGDYTLVNLSFAHAGARAANSASDQWAGGALEVGVAQ
jgi:hypothetical protein